jgi:hypothetical protein
MSKQYKIGDIVTVENEVGSWVVVGVEPNDFNGMGKGYYLQELGQEGIFAKQKDMELEQDNN